MLRKTPAFRHDPLKYVLFAKSSGPVHWTREPAVCGYRRLQHENRRLGRTVDVPVSASPAVVTGIGVVLASDDGYVRFYDTALNKVYWERRVDSSIYASLVVDAERRHVIVAATSGLITCFDLRGSLVWSAKAGVPVYATPAVLPDADTLIVAAFSSRCLGFNLGTGALVFDRDLPQPWATAHGGSAAHRDAYASPAGTAEGTAIVCCAEHVLALAADGTELWRQEIGQTIKASPAAVQSTGEVAVCPVDGRCLFLDSTSGQLRSEVFLGAKITASPAVSGNVLAIGTQCDTALGLDVRTHEVLWTSRQGAPRSYTSFSLLPDGAFVATGSRGNVVCLRPADGRFLWESSQVLGLPDHDPAMDTTPVVGPDGNLYCGSYSGVIYRFRFQPVDAEDAS